MSADILERRAAAGGDLVKIESKRRDVYVSQLVPSPPYPAFTITERCHWSYKQNVITS